MPQRLLPSKMDSRGSGNRLFMASLNETQVAPATARDGFDTRKQDLNVARDDKREVACWSAEEYLFALENEYEEGSLDSMCQHCAEFEATRRFMHLRNGEFWLCEDCFLCCADHARNYGDDFLSKEEAVALKRKLESDAEKAAAEKK